MFFFLLKIIPLKQIKIYLIIKKNPFDKLVCEEGEKNASVFSMFFLRTGKEQGELVTFWDLESLVLS